MKKLLLAAFLLFASSSGIFATCSSGFNEIIVMIVPDGYPAETSWNIVDTAGNILASGGFTGDTICVPVGTCLEVNILDSYGDGIYTPGGYWIYEDGFLVGTGNSFGFHAQYSLNCPAGMTCLNPIPLAMGNATAMFDNSWYTFTPATTGTYNISTCGTNTCDTKIWVYTNCPLAPYDEGPPGTYAYNDDYCGSQASLNVVLTAGMLYYIRIGDYQDDCSGPEDFTLSYIGAVQGCTDPLACNYNPMAMVDDSSCIYYPNVNCTGPDLQFDSLSFVQSLSISQITASTCDVTEGCLLDYGSRYVLQFTSKINNIGNQDYYIGNPSANPTMFNFTNCHGHAHYEGYGDYRLIDSNGILVPAGHKNGYCVMDLCGTGHYNCGDMGISSGCYDAYGAGTQCQWFDITDVPDGDYRMAIIINSHHLPDALGHYELNFVNNATQICIHISHSGAVPYFTILPACAPFVDCSGMPAGTAEMDCNQICNGPGYFGDTYSDSHLDSLDIDTYMDLFQSGLPAVSCYDLNGDGDESVIDAALLNWCIKGNSNGPGGNSHNHCNFPRNITNPNDTVGLAIRIVNFIDNYVDVEVRNISTGLKAFQFTMSGITISSVVSLASPVDFPVDVRYIAATNEVIGISHVDSLLARATTAQELVRIYFSAITDTIICISAITDLVNQNAEQTIHLLYNACRTSPTTGISGMVHPADLVVIPNPAHDRAFIHLPTAIEPGNELIIFDVSGKLYTIPVKNFKEDWFEIDLTNLAKGVYYIKINDSEVHGVVKFVRM